MIYKFATLTIFLLSIGSSYASNYNFEKNYENKANTLYEMSQDLTYTYWGYQSTSSILLNNDDEDDEPGMCKVTLESKGVTILWSAICWGGGSVEVSIPCADLDLNEVL